MYDVHDHNSDVTSLDLLSNRAYNVGARDQPGEPGKGFLVSIDPQAGAQPIGTLNEGPLHAALKAWYTRPGDGTEVPVDGYVVDLVRGELLIEIQTAGFASIKAKLADLAARHPLRLVYPLARDKWIVKLADDLATEASRRKSPKRGAVEEIFAELVSFPHLLARPGFALEVLLIQEEEVRRYEAGRAWRRRGWVTHERRLLAVVGRRLFASPADVGALLPPGLPQPFTTADLAEALGKGRRLAQKMAYCLREIGEIDVVGKRGRAVLYGQGEG
jgi:hypothetical protein